MTKGSSECNESKGVPAVSGWMTVLLTLPVSDQSRHPLSWWKESQSLQQRLDPVPKGKAISITEMRLPPSSFIAPSLNVP